MAEDHISPGIRSDLAKLGTDKAARVREVAFETRPLVDDRRSGAAPASFSYNTGPRAE